MKQMTCGFLIKAKDWSNRQKIGSLFMDQKHICDFMSETEPGTLVTINDEDYEPLGLKYETEYTIGWFLACTILFSYTRWTEFIYELYILNF